MTTTLTVRPTALFQPTYAGSSRVLRRRMHTLQITDHQLTACVSMQDVQQLAKIHFTRLAHEYHPDTARQHRARGGPLVHYGDRFQRIVKAYRWVMRQPNALLWQVHPPAEISHAEPEDMGYGWHVVYY